MIYSEFVSKLCSRGEICLSPKILLPLCPDDGSSQTTHSPLEILTLGDNIVEALSQLGEIAFIWSEDVCVFMRVCVCVCVCAVLGARFVLLEPCLNHFVTCGIVGNVLVRSEVWLRLENLAKVSSFSQSVVLQPLQSISLSLHATSHTSIFSSSTVNLIGHGYSQT